MDSRFPGYELINANLHCSKEPLKLASLNDALPGEGKGEFRYCTIYVCFKGCRGAALETGEGLPVRVP